MTSYYGLETQACIASLESLAPAFAPWTLDALKEAGVEGLMGAVPAALNPFLKCAVDVALHDLWAKGRRRRLGRLWKQNRRRQTPTCYTIGLASMAEMVRKLKAKPWPIYKIKLGGEGGGDDVGIIRELRRHTKAPFYVDANTGWTVSQTIDHAIHLKQLGVKFIEQPLQPADVEGQREVNRHCVLPILADESCQTEDDVEKCSKLYTGINIKIVKCGGLLPARRMIARARELGLQLMAGCMTESSVGISAIAQLLPELDYADMDGAMLLASDPANGVTFDPQTGYAVYPNRSGTGALLA